MTELFGMKFYDKPLNSIVNNLKEAILLGKKVRVYTPNVDHIINIKENDSIFQKYREAEYIVADGWPVVATAKLRKKVIHKITGVDLMDELLKISNKEKLNIFLLGATDETLKILKGNLIRDFNNIGNIEYHNGYFTKEEESEIINIINKSNSNILFVGMGSPKQELWISDNIEKLNINVAVAIGGALKIYSNEIKRAPKLVQKIGMEWFYRFLKEPNRLFYRYFIKYPKFIKYFILEMRDKR